MSSVAERTVAASPAGGPRRSKASILQGVAIAVGFAMMVGGFGLLAFNYRPYRVPSASMAPTVNVGDTVLASRSDGSSVGRGDIVVFKDSDWGNAILVKRVVAVGGDTVACCDSRNQRLTVNGHLIDEPYANVVAGNGSPFSVTVPAGRLFLLGDARSNSLDSRYHLDVAAGSVPASSVVARVDATILPFSRLSVHQRTAAFDQLGGPVAHGPGPVEPAAYAAVGGGALVLLAAAAGWLVSLAAWVRRRRA